MNFQLTDEQRSLQEAARNFARAKLPDIARECEETNHAPDKTVVREFAEMGFLGINVPERYGGLGLGNVEALLVLEEFGKISSAVAFPGVRVLRRPGARHRALRLRIAEAARRARGLPRRDPGRRVDVGAAGRLRAHRPDDAGRDCAATRSC